MVVVCVVIELVAEDEVEVAWGDDTAPSITSGASASKVSRVGLLQSTPPFSSIPQHAHNCASTLYTTLGTRDSTVHTTCQHMHATSQLVNLSLNSLAHQPQSPTSTLQPSSPIPHLIPTIRPNPFPHLELSTYRNVYYKPHYYMSHQCTTQLANHYPCRLP